MHSHTFAPLRETNTLSIGLKAPRSQKKHIIQSKIPAAPRELMSACSQHIIQVGQHFIPPGPCLSRRNEASRQCLPAFGQFLFVGLNIALNILFPPIRFRECNTKGNMLFSQPIRKLQVYFLGWDTSIHQLKHTQHLRTVFQVVADHFFKLLALVFRHLSEAIAG